MLLEGVTSPEMHHGPWPSPLGTGMSWASATLQWQWQYAVTLCLLARSRSSSNVRGREPHRSPDKTNHIDTGVGGGPGGIEPRSLLRIGLFRWGLTASLLTVSPPGEKTRSDPLHPGSRFESPYMTFDACGYLSTSRSIHHSSALFHTNILST